MATVQLNVLLIDQHKTEYSAEVFTFFKYLVDSYLPLGIPDEQRIATARSEIQATQNPRLPTLSVIIRRIIGKDQDTTNNQKKECCVIY